jgi:LysW-gamma-L-lysine carboxypeptidase
VKCQHYLEISVQYPAIMALTPSDSVNLLEHLVSIPSPSGQEEEASSWFVDWLAAHSFDAHVDAAGNAVGICGNGPRQILLLGHIDTFPGELPVRHNGDWLYGRGTVDAKGSLCAFAAAAAAADVPPGWQVAVVGAVEEEAATSRGARHLIANWPAPEMCIIGEPSGWDRITLGYKGRLLAEIKLRAPFAHSASQNPLPAEQAVNLWNTIVARCAEFNAGRKRVFHRLDPSLRHIITHDEGASGTAQMSLGFRLPPDLSPETLTEDLKHLLEAEGWSMESEQPAPAPSPSLKPPDSNSQLVANLIFSGAEAAFRAEKNTPLVRTFVASIREQGGKPRFVSKTGTSDMNVVGPAWTCPICAYGPGDSAFDHTPQEGISLSEYLRSIQVLRSALHTLMRNAVDQRAQ